MQAEKAPTKQRLQAPQLVSLGRNVVRSTQSTELLSSVGEPAQLRQLSRSQLRRLSHELRVHLIELGSRIGGHFAGSLGTVELTIAVHAVFETPHDRLVWDVGHQAYGHKALTGRLAALESIKREGGPSGFLRRCESEFDAFGAGHAGTSISAVLGMAEAFAHQGLDHCAVAIIGDGGITAGMALEALNHAGDLTSRVRVVLNDNGMSIAPTVGGLSRNGEIADLARAFGWTVQGPVDGHDLDALLDAMGELRDSDGPTLLHVRTRKGQGYPPAEEDPYRWHATSAFDVATGSPRVLEVKEPASPSWTAAFAQSLERLAERDPRVLAITAAMPDGTGLEGFAERFPDRFFDVAIAEQHAVTFAAGLAAEGLRPVCAIYSTFLQRAFDQIVHDVALQGLPVTFALDRAGLVGADGATHHGALDLAYLRIVPNLVVAAPRDRDQLQRILATAIDSDRPFALRFPRGEVVDAPLDPEPKPLRIGTGEVLREGGDVALFAVGKTVPIALLAAEHLATMGIAASVTDARFVKPLDRELLAEMAGRGSFVLCLEDHVLAGGFGSAVLEAFSELGVEAAVARCGLPDRFIEHGETERQWADLEMDAHAVVRRVLDRLEGSRP